MKQVLVLCTGNSCRSIMAEALINHLGKGSYQAMSAGSFPVGYVHPESLETLKRHKIPFGELDKEIRSKSWDEFQNSHFDYVITVCDSAANESCPLFSGPCKKLHWSTPDPAKASGSEAQIQQAFDDAFQLLKTRIETELL